MVLSVEKCPDLYISTLDKSSLVTANEFVCQQINPTAGQMKIL
jgi:hypothetical protein